MKLYQGHFLKAEKHGNEDRSIHITNIAQILDEMRGRALWICFMPANDRIGPGQNIAKIFASHKNKELSRRLPPLLSFLADRKPLHSTFPASTISRNVHY